MRRRALSLALFNALFVACGGGAPVEAKRPVHLASVDTLRSWQIAQVRGSGLANVHALLIDGVKATELVACP